MLKAINGRYCLFATLAAIGLSVSACGGGGSNTLAQREVEQAEKHGREEAQEKAKEAGLERKLAKLERENRAARRRRREKLRQSLDEQAPAPPDSGSSAPESTDPAPPSGTDCGGGVTAGPETSCGFAINTRTEYETEIGSGSGTVYPYSEANEQTYEMHCTEGAEHVCSGAITATVYWP